jgi:hypothetical protein
MTSPKVLEAVARAIEPVMNKRVTLCAYCPDPDSCDCARAVATEAIATLEAKLSVCLDVWGQPGPLYDEARAALAEGNKPLD